MPTLGYSVAPATHSVIFTPQVDGPFFSAHWPGVVRKPSDGPRIREERTQYVDLTDCILVYVMRYQISDPTALTTQVLRP